MMFALLGAGLICGLLARRFQLLPSGAPDAINAVIINVALPAMILLRIPELTLDTVALIPVGLAWLVIGISAAAVLLLARGFAWPRKVTGALLMVVPLSNTAYLGLPLIDAFSAPSVLPYAILYDQMGNFMGLAIYASIVIAVYSTSDDGVNVASVARRIVRFPPFIAALVALALPANLFPSAAVVVLEFLAIAIGPLAMIIVGLQLELSVHRHLRSAIVTGTVLKLIAAPALVFIVAASLGLSGPAVSGSFLQAAMPPMITAGLLGIAAGFSRPLILALIGIGSITSLLTLPTAFFIAETFSR